MKIKKLIYSIILILFALSNQAFAKALPPGSGIGDVPANVLIMLDKSGSMGWRMSGGTASMRYPYDADADSNGDVLVSQYNRDGVKKFLYGSKTLDTGFGTEVFLEKVIEDMKVIEIAKHLTHIAVRLTMMFITQQHIGKDQL